MEELERIDSVNLVMMNMFLIKWLIVGRSRTTYAALNFLVLHFLATFFLVFLLSGSSDISVVQRNL